MSAIKLPVSAIPAANFHRLWKVHDADNFMLCRDLSESQAKQIVLALNLHDELVSALEYLQHAEVDKPFTKQLRGLLERAKP